MAHLVVRSAMNMTRRGFFSSAARLALPEDMPDMKKVMTGLEKKEYEANLAGNEDPFALNAVIKTPGSGTRDKPNLIPSATGQRMVGCLCDGEDSIAPNWINLYEGRPQRCECGQWYSIKKIDFVE